MFQAPLIIVLVITCSARAQPADLPTVQLAEQIAAALVRPSTPVDCADSSVLAADIERYTQAVELAGGFQRYSASCRCLENGATENIGKALSFLSIQRTIWFPVWLTRPPLLADSVSGHYDGTSATTADNIAAALLSPPLRVHCDDDSRRTEMDAMRIASDSLSTALLKPEVVRECPQDDVHPMCSQLRALADTLPEEVGRRLRSEMLSSASAGKNSRSTTIIKRFLIVPLHVVLTDGASRQLTHIDIVARLLTSIRSRLLPDVETQGSPPPTSNEPVGASLSTEPSVVPLSFSVASVTRTPLNVKLEALRYLHYLRLDGSESAPLSEVHKRLVIRNIPGAGVDRSQIVRWWNQREKLWQRKTERDVTPSPLYSHRRFQTYDIELKKAFIADIKSHRGPERPDSYPIAAEVRSTITRLPNLQGAPRSTLRRWWRMREAITGSKKIGRAMISRHSAQGHRNIRHPDSWHECVEEQIRSFVDNGLYLSVRLSSLFAYQCAKKYEEDFPTPPDLNHYFVQPKTLHRYGTCLTVIIVIVTHI